MRTPGNDEELAAGFLVSEGIVRRAADVVRVELCGRHEMGNLVNVVLAAEVVVAPKICLYWNRDGADVARRRACGAAAGLAGPRIFA